MKTIITILLVGLLFISIDAKKNCRSNEPCYVSGCFKELCVDDPNLVFPCPLIPVGGVQQNPCYVDATCKRQRDGKCGWTQTKELEKCLANQN